MLCILFNTKKTKMHTSQNDRNDLFANTLSLALLDSQWEIIYKNKGDLIGPGSSILIPIVNHHFKSITIYPFYSVTTMTIDTQTFDMLAGMWDETDLCCHPTLSRYPWMMFVGVTHSITSLNSKNWDRWGIKTGGEEPCPTLAGGTSPS